MIRASVLNVPALSSWQLYGFSKPTKGLPSSILQLPSAWFWFISSHLSSMLHCYLLSALIAICYLHVSAVHMYGNFLRSSWWQMLPLHVPCLARVLMASLSMPSYPSFPYHLATFCIPHARLRAHLCVFCLKTPEGIEVFFQQLLIPGDKQVM